MNRLQTLKRFLLLPIERGKNLLWKNWQNHIGTKQVDVELLDNGIKGTVTSLSGGYNTLLHWPVFENPQWGKTYTLTCNIEESISNMGNALRVGYWRSDITTWKDIGQIISINKGNGVYSVTFTLPTEQPEFFRPNITDYFYGLRMFFNIQKTSGLAEYGSITVTDIYISQE